MLAKEDFICGDFSALLPVSIKVVKYPLGIILKEFEEENDVNQIVVRR